MNETRSSSSCATHPVVYFSDTGDPFTTRQALVSSEGLAHSPPIRSSMKKKTRPSGGHEYAIGRVPRLRIGECPANRQGSQEISHTLRGWTNKRSRTKSPPEAWSNPGVQHDQETE